MVNSVLEARSICKSFNGQKLLDRVNIELKSGEIHGLVGPNGSGKSTLANILGGLRPMDRGQICLNHRSVNFQQPRDALKQGIALFHQDLNLIPELSIMDNILLPNLDRQNLGSPSERTELCQNLLEQLDAPHFDLNAKVETLSLEEQYKVEMARVLAVDPHFLIIDEPFAQLGADQAALSSRWISRLAQLGLAILLISHRYSFLLPLCQHISILKDGKLQAWKVSPPYNENELIQEIYGPIAAPGEVKRSKRQTAENPLVFFRTEWEDHSDLELQGQSGRILGYYSQDRRAVKTLFDSLYGLCSLKGAQYRFNGKDFSAQSPQEAIAQGILVLPDKSMGNGMVSQHSILDNILLPILPRLKLRYLLDTGKSRNKAKESAHSVALKEDLEETPYSHLSGGNKQKVSLARALAAHGKCLILQEPLAGLDQRAVKALALQLKSLCKKGKSVVIISCDKDQLTSVCHGVSPLIKPREESRT